MRTTLDIDEDVREAPKELAARRGTTAGRVISELVRSTLARRDLGAKKRHGVPALPTLKPAALVTPEMVNQLRDEA